MTSLTAASRSLTSPRWQRADWRHGLRLAIAVAASFAVSTLLGLPESLWAVMSALIVVRPTTGSALGAGWDRVRGTMSGTVIGLAGVWLHQIGSGSHIATLAIIAAVAFLSAIVPTLRSAPISALIILNSGGIAGHSALDVAGLRAIEIVIGVATGVVVSLFAFATHARERFVEAAVDWLRTTARQTIGDLSGDPDTANDPAAGRPSDGAAGAQPPSPGVNIAADTERRREANRKALRHIAELAVGAAREARWLARLGRVGVAPVDHVACARMLARIASDVGAVQRAAASAPVPLDRATRRALATALGDALMAAADALDDAANLPTERTPHETPPTKPATSQSALRRWAAHDAPQAWIAPTAHLLLQDLRHLRGLATRGGGRGARPSESA